MIATIKYQGDYGEERLHRNDKLHCPHCGIGGRLWTPTKNRGIASYICSTCGRTSTIGVRPFYKRQRSQMRAAMRVAEVMKPKIRAKKADPVA